MRFLLPCVLALIQTVTSRPEDFSKHERHNDIAIPSVAKDLRLFQQSPQVELNEANDLMSWEKFRPEPQVGDYTKSMGLSDVDDGMIFDQFDDTVPEDYQEIELARLTNYLTTLLRQQTWNTPLVIVEDPPAEDFPETPNPEIRPMWKRSKYYRRYPWKRQNGRSRNTYDYDAPHICTPSREDVYQLLVALHDVRTTGNKSRTVHYCNRRRPVGTVFTNIRFLGRRK